MAKTLGLDIGTTSIGWCLMEDKNRIVRSGVRIFPVGVQEDKFAKSSAEESKNAARRTARGFRRGYDRYKLRRKQLRRILLELNMLPERLEMPSARALYELHVRGLDEKLELKEIGRVLLHLNQRRGFKSNRKAAPKDGDDEKGIKLQMTELKKKVHDLGFRTLGEYFLSLYTANKTKENWHNEDEPIERLRKRFIHRSMYEEEFEAIWKTQSKFYPDILTEERRREIKERCIYYQRDLKSQKGRVGKCRFELKKRVAPKSSLSFQEFRIWESLSRIRVTDNKRHLGALTLEEKEILAEVLAETEELSQAKIKTLIRLPKAAYLNDIDKIKGNTTAAKIMKVVGQEVWRTVPDEKREHIWHVLYFAPDESWLREWGKKNLGLIEEQAEGFGDISLEKDYSRISHKAINKMLPFLKKGMDYSEAKKAAGYEVTQDKQLILEDRIERKKNDEINQLRSPIVMRALSETISLVNAIIQEEGRPDQIRIEFARPMKMPKMAREQLKNKNRDKERQREEYKEFLKDKLKYVDVSQRDITKFELWLEMEFAEEDLRKINTSIDVEEFRKFARNVRPSDKQKYELWLECGRISPYTGKPISLGRLFSPDIEIEHIVPYSRTFDNSFRNKTLCEREFNDAKGNRTPFEYFKSQPEELQQFKQRIKDFPNRRKQILFIREVIEGDFKSGSIESTAWIAKEARNILLRVCNDVRVTGGQVTSILRRYWGLDKDRNDNRHHAVDAFVIANTNEWWINLLSKASATDPHRKLSDNVQEILRTPAGQDLVKAAGLGVSVEEDEADPLGLQHVNPATGEILSGGIPGPYPNHRHELDKVLSRMLISYRKNARLLSPKINSYVYSRPKNGIKKQRSIAVRGSLHQDSLFGKILDPHTGQVTYVIRKSVEELSTESLKLIVDDGVRDALQSHLNSGRSLKDKAYQFSRDGKKKIPIRHVRIKTDKKTLVEIRPGTFVLEGDNYILAIYGTNTTKKREREIASFFKASQRALKRQPVFPHEVNGLPLLMTLQKADLIVTYEKHSDEIDWNNLEDIFSRLFRIIEIGADKIIYARHYASGFDKKKDRNTLVFQANYNTLKAVRVDLSFTGKIRT